MTMHDGADIRARAIDFAVNEAFELGRSRVGRRRRCVKIEGHDVAGLRQTRRHAASEQKAIGALGVTSAHMAEAVYDLLVEKNMVGLDKLVYRRRDGGTCRFGGLAQSGALPSVREPKGQTMASCAARSSRGRRTLAASACYVGN